MSKVYVAIIGTRGPDNEQRWAARRLAAMMSSVGIVTRTGAAIGIDQAAMEGATSTLLEVYLPWESYNQGIIPGGCRKIVYDIHRHTEWIASVNIYHPAPGRLSRGAQALMARNFGIINGDIGEDRCHAVFAFPDEKGEGGTGQGIRIANALGVKLFEGRRGKVNAKDFEAMIYASTWWTSINEDFSTAPLATENGEGRLL